MPIGDKLAKMQDAWKESEQQYKTTFGGEKIPEGQYIARVQKAALREAKTSGKIMIGREHVIMEGDLKGSVVFDNMQLETPLGLAFTRRWIERMGYVSPDEVNGLLDVCNDITEKAPTVKIAVKHSGDFVNVDVLEVLEDGGAATAGAASEASAETATTAPAGKTAAKKAGAASPKEKVRDDDDRIKDARELAAAWGIKLPKTADTLPKIRKELSEYTFARKECTKSDLALLEELELAGSLT